MSNCLYLVCCFCTLISGCMQVLALVRTAQAQPAPDAPAQAAVDDAQMRLLVRSAPIPSPFIPRAPFLPCVEAH